MIRLGMIKLTEEYICWKKEQAKQLKEELDKEIKDNKELTKHNVMVNDENNNLKQKLEKIVQKLTREKATISSAVTQKDEWAVALNDFIDELKEILEKSE